MKLLDATGIALDMRTPGRIVSLVPSLTEALFALGAGDRIAGVTQFCEEPAELVHDLPKVGGTKTPDVQAIVRLRPDLIIASIEENREEDVLALRAAGLAVFVTHFPTVRSSINGIARLAELTDVAPHTVAWLAEADRLTSEFTGRDARQDVTYFCPIWRRPYMVARRDTYMSDLLALAGGKSVFPDDGPSHYNAVELPALAARAPAVILMPDEPYRFAPRHLSDFALLAGVPAVANHQMHFIDGKALTWYGPRTAGALRQFAQLFRQAAATARPQAERPVHAS
ncbi:MAG: helical backbone metal receptor [Dehalococcoidia bacterium]